MWRAMCLRNTPADGIELYEERKSSLDLYLSEGDKT